MLTFKRRDIEEGLPEKSGRKRLWPQGFKNKKDGAVVEMIDAQLDHLEYLKS